MWRFALLFCDVKICRDNPRVFVLTGKGLRDRSANPDAVLVVLKHLCAIPFLISLHLAIFSKNLQPHILCSRMMNAGPKNPLEVGKHLVASMKIRYSTTSCGDTQSEMVWSLYAVRVPCLVLVICDAKRLYLNVRINRVPRLESPIYFHCRARLFGLHDSQQSRASFLRRNK